MTNKLQNGLDHIIEGRDEAIADAHGLLSDRKGAEDCIDLMKSRAYNTLAPLPDIRGEPIDQRTGIINRALIEQSAKRNEILLLFRSYSDRTIIAEPTPLTESAEKLNSIIDDIKPRKELILDRAMQERRNAEWLAMDEFENFQEVVSCFVEIRHEANTQSSLIRLEPEFNRCFNEPPIDHEWIWDRMMNHAARFYNDDYLAQLPECQSA